MAYEPARLAEQKGVAMRTSSARARVAGCAVVLGCLAFPMLLRAQTTTTSVIAGIVRDTTGAVMPGVTVEASSPALIEKIRTGVTDGEGQYKIVDLRPGTYSVTFTLPGFGTSGAKASSLPRASRPR